jgi:hypothetical protein
MDDNHVMGVGAAIAAIAALAFVATWVLIAKFPSKVLLGGLEGLWLRCLVRVIYIGLAIIVLAVLRDTLVTISLWR